MKIINLPIQHYYGDTEPPNKIFVKIDGMDARSFEDKECTKLLNPKIGLVYLKLTVPDELELIEIPSCGVCTPAQDVSLSFDCGFGQKYKDVCGIEIIWDNDSFQVPVNNGFIDSEKWDNFLNYDEKGHWLFVKRWILEVWTLKDKTIGIFRFHQNLIKQLFIPKEIKELPIELSTKHGIPCLWEEGGRKYRESGSSTIICKPDGQPKKPIFVEKRQGASKHALLGIAKGDIVIKAEIDSFDNEMFEILQIESIDKENRIAKVFKIAEWRGRFWRCKEIADKYEKAYTAALEKAKCINCRKPFFVFENQV